MSSALPLYRQQKDNTCALACLRMVLAAYGVHVEESDLEAEARMVKRGTLIDELERLARQFHLAAQIQQISVEGLAALLDIGKLPIAYIDRAVFELSPQERTRHSIRDAIIHTVIPVQVTPTSVVCHDPRLPRIDRKTIRLFRRAYEGLGGNCVVCSQPD